MNPDPHRIFNYTNRDQSLIGLVFLFSVRVFFARHYEEAPKSLELFKPQRVYNNFMTRNHFSKHGGPYFINNGVTGHRPNQDHVPASRRSGNNPIKKITTAFKKSLKFIKP